LTSSINSLRALLLFACLLPASCSPATPPETGEVEAPVAAPPAPTPWELHRDALVFDAHTDTLIRVSQGADICRRSEEGHLDLIRMREGGVDAQFFSVWMNASYRGRAAITNTLALIDRLLRSFEECPERVGLALNAADVERLNREGRIAALIGIEGGHAMGGELSALRMYHRLGVRYMGLTWSNTNEFADSSEDRARWNGLNELGREVVREMNRMGMIVDVSHLSDKAFWDAMEVTSRPVIASHSSARAVHDVVRNMSDDMLREMARNGGVVCVNFYSRFLAPGGERAPFESLIDHIDHMVRVSGADHVGLGSDFDGVDSLPVGIDDVSDMPKITAALLERGHAPEDIRKILGLNLLRVLREVTGE
jgi:membrane dipeptidase